MKSLVFPLGEIRISSALSHRACSVLAGGPGCHQQAEELAAGQDHAFGDKAVDRGVKVAGSLVGAGAGVRGRVLVKAGLGGGTEGLGEVRVVVPGLDEEQFWCWCVCFNVPGHQSPSSFPMDRELPAMWPL